MATNAAGFPYPLGTDRVMDGDDAIKALADKVSWFQTGTVALAGDATANRIVPVTFPVQFPRAPIVFLIALTGLTAATQNQHVSPSSITPTGFSANGVRNNTTTITVQWVAFLINGVAGP